MRFVTVRQGRRVFMGLEEEGGVIDLAHFSLSRTFVDWVDFIAHHEVGDLEEMERSRAALARYAIPSEDLRFLSPIERPVHDLLCVGLNYLDHIQESQGAAGVSQGPGPAGVYFSKRAGRILGHQDPVGTEHFADSSLDYEVELAVIIGKEGVNISKEQAMDHVFGYSILNDITCRQLQSEHGQWFKGKSLDGYTAMGPAIVHKGDLALPLHLELSLRVNDQLRQSSNTQLMIRDVPALIEELSLGMTLVPGDIIATGTPAGVGMGFDPPRYLQSGDRVDCRVEGLGLLSNTVV